MSVAADPKRPFREPSPGFTELTSSFDHEQHPLAAAAAAASSECAAPSSPTRTDASSSRHQPPPLSTILSPAERKKKKLIDSPFVVRQASLAITTDNEGRRNSIFEIVSHPMLDGTTSDADDAQKDYEGNHNKQIPSVVHVNGSTDQDEEEKKAVHATPQLGQAAAAAAAAAFLPSKRSSITTMRRASITGSSSNSNSIGLEALKRLGLGERQVSQRWTSLLRTSNAVAVAKRKFAPKKAKLHNLWADKLDDDESFDPPMFEKNVSDKALVQDAMKHNFVFDTFDPLVLDRLTDAMELVEFAAGETIIQQGDKGDYFYAIKEGEVDFFVDQVPVGSAPAGRSFGELALLYTCHRAATAKASMTIGKSTTLFRMDQKSFRHILKDQMKKSRRSKLKLLHKIKPFRDVEKSDLKVLAAAMEPHIFEKGDVVWMKGDPSPPFCAVQEGELDFTNITIKNRECKDKKLGPGDYFGEQSLGNRDPAEGTVTALTRVLAFCIDRQTFDRDFGGLKRLVDKSIDKRRLSVMASIKKANLDDDGLNTLADHVVDITFEAGCTIFVKGKNVNPAIYLVRQGTIEIVRGDGNGETKEEVTGGGSFGQEMENYKTTKSKSGRVRHEHIAEYTAKAVTRAVCGVLSLPDCPVLFDAQSIEMVSERYTPASCDLSLDDLIRHRVLGEGQFGQVWLVSSKREEVPKGMALKIQAKDNKSRPAAVKAIWDEIKSMKKLEHPLLVSLITAFQDKKEIYMLLTLAHGGELFDIIHQQDEEGNYVSGIGEKGIFYAAVVADAIAFMHRQKFVYRDLKPENVLIDEMGYPVLSDFGFAKLLEDKTYTFCGTPNYLPPEVIANSGHDWSADNWSLGVLIYELLEGENPFYYHGMDQMALFEAICTEKYYPMAKEVSPEALELIDRLLRKNPNKRLGTFREKDILAHPWFSSLDMVKLRNKEVEAPWTPDPIQLHR